jgi:hypothetical protein
MLTGVGSFWRAGGLGVLPLAGGGVAVFVAVAGVPSFVGVLAAAVTSFVGVAVAAVVFAIAAAEISVAAVADVAAPPGVASLATGGVLAAGATAHAVSPTRHTKA